MGKIYKIGIIIFLLLLGLLSYMEASKPEPINWSPSYTATDKIPLGNYVLFENLKDQVPQIEAISQPPFEFLTDSTLGGIYFFVNTQLLFDKDELHKLLQWVEKGNTLFLASDAFSKSLLDTLHLNVSTLIPREGISSKPMMNLVHRDFASDSAFLYDQETYHSVFSQIDTLNHTVLGVSQLFEDSLFITKPEVNFLKTGFGKGQIFIHTTPQAFSNFFSLYGNNVEYLEKALSYLPLGEILYWDTYYKAGKPFQTSPLYILLSKRAFKWAYYFTLIGAFLFIVFEGKRKQRSIPVRSPLKNQTYHFTRTISGLYLDRKDYKRIASKKITLFLDYVRIQYRISTASCNQDFCQKLANHSGSTFEEVQNLLHLIQQLENKNTISKEELLELTATIDTIKLKRNGK